MCVLTYTWPGSNWRPSACEADVIATRPQVRVLIFHMQSYASPLSFRLGHRNYAYFSPFFKKTSSSKRARHSQPPTKHAPGFSLALDAPLRAKRFSFWGKCSNLEHERRHVFAGAPDSSARTPHFARCHLRPRCQDAPHLIRIHCAGQSARQHGTPAHHRLSGQVVEATPCLRYGNELSICAVLLGQKPRKLRVYCTPGQDRTGDLQRVGLTS